MKAIVQERFGPPDVLQLVDTDPPEVGADDVLVRVHAAALNPYDWHIMRGDPLVARLMGEVGLTRPKARVAGIDAAGRVEAVGANVRGLRPGDEVLGFCRGAFAEYARAEADKVVPKPVSLTFEQAAAVPMAGTTALRGIRDVGAVRAGHRVLVNGAAGGVGTYAVQIAAALGAEVTGVCSTRNVELVRSIGAAHVVDYTTEDFTDGRARYDVILDNVGNRPLSRLRRALTPTGTLVLNGGGSPGHVFGPVGCHPAGGRGQRVSSESGSDCSRTNRSGSNCSPSPGSSRPGSSHRSSTGPTRWPTRPRACATWSRDTHAARSSSPWPEAGQGAPEPADVPAHRSAAAARPDPVEVPGRRSPWSVPTEDAYGSLCATRGRRVRSGTVG